MIKLFPLLSLAVVPVIGNALPKSKQKSERTNNSVLHTLNDIWASFYSIFGHIASSSLKRDKKLFQISSQIKAKQFLEVSLKY